MPKLARAPQSWLLCAALALAGCAALPATPAARDVAREAVAQPLPDAADPRAAGIIALDDEMRAFLAREVQARDDPTKLHELIHAVMESATFRIDYGDDTRSASDTFHARRGNCLSFTNLFVALAREVGLAVRYQEVDVPPTWTAHEDSFVVSRHINAVVTVRAGVEHVVDFNMAEFRAAYPRRAISDERAAAHYFSNLGVERMQAGEPDAAFANFRRALALDATLAQTWVNLGAWRRRQGDAALAEASYLEALRLNPREYGAMSNLAGLHAREGRGELAAWYRRRVTHYRQQNPYFRYEQAKRAYLAGDFAEAARVLRGALRDADTDPTFYSLLGASYRELGRREDAREAFAKAVALADDEDLRSAVRHKLELLGAPSAGL
jgi:Flp pilus assembly protein TadD